MIRFVFNRIKEGLLEYVTRPWHVIAPGDVGKFYQLAACLIFKNGAAYLKEWLDFHRLVGVEKFFLYNNDSSDEYEQVLAPSSPRE